MNKLAKDELIAGAHTTLEDMLKEIDAVTEQQISCVARDSFISKRIALTALGPFTSRQGHILSARYG
jgi:predicted Zn-dependent peptidase